MAIDATVGGSTANSYVTQAEVDAYMGARFGASAWSSLSSGDKEIALRQATREIDRYRFKGQRNTTSQALAFPRTYPYNSDTPDRSAAASIPQSVKEACCEHALHLVANRATGGVSQRQHLQAQGVTSFTVGDLSETYGGAGATFGISVSSTAAALLARWIDRSAAITVTGRDEIADSLDWHN